MNILGEAFSKEPFCEGFCKEIFFLVLLLFPYSLTYLFKTSYSYSRFS